MKSFEQVLKNESQECLNNVYSDYVSPQICDPIIRYSARTVEFSRNYRHFGTAIKKAPPSLRLDIFLYKHLSRYYF